MNVRILLLIPLTFLIIGGCFGGVIISDDDDDGFPDSDEIIRGTIIDVVPSRPGDVDNIAVDVIDDESGRIFFDVTDSTGFFSVEGTFDGTPRVEFTDEEDEGFLLGIINLNVFPGARLDLGNVRLQNNNVFIEDDIIVRFVGDIVDNNCIDTSGSLTVRAENRSSVDVIVQISNSTDITNNGTDLTCDDLFVGDKVRITGVLLTGNNVEGDRVEVE